MSITQDEWRKAMLAKRPGRTRWTLIAYDDWDCEAPIVYAVIGTDDIPSMVNTWFTVPTHLARAYVSARKALELVEIELDEYRELNGHRRLIGGHRIIV